MKHKKLAQAFAISALPLIAACTPGTIALSSGQNHRSMTDHEVAFARTIFGKEIDYGKVKIYKQRAKTGRARGGVYNGVYMPQSVYTNDYALRGTFHMQSIFIHELTHVWQKQHGKNIVGNAVGLYFEKGGNYDLSYDYTLADLPDFKNLNIEQQASIVEDYFQVRHKVIADNDRKMCAGIRVAESALRPSFPDLKTPKPCR